MKVGAEPKKLLVLAGLLAVAGVAYYFSSKSDDVPPDARPAAKRTVRSSTPAGFSAPPVISQAPRLSRGAARGSQEFRPSLKSRNPEERADPMTVDPTLRLDLLAKLLEVKLEGGHRSLFDFSPAPPPKTPDVKIVPKTSQPGAAEAVAGAAGSAADPVKPPAPPIQLKFYGYISPVRQGVKRAFFLDGEEIYVASEGEVIKKRYKVVRIGVNSAVVEDLEYQHQQTLPLVEQPA